MAAGPVLVVDFGAQYAQLIARRVREANVYSELVPHSMPVDEMLAKDPQAIILSGGPASVFEPGAPRVDKKLFEAGVPVLANVEAILRPMWPDFPMPLTMTRPRPARMRFTASRKAPLRRSASARMASASIRNTWRPRSSAWEGDWIWFMGGLRL